MEARKKKNEGGGMFWQCHVGKRKSSFGIAYRLRSEIRMCAVCNRVEEQTKTTK